MSRNAIMLLRQMRRVPRPYRSRWWKHMRSGMAGFIPGPYPRTIFHDSFDHAFDMAARNAVEGHRHA